MNVTTQTPITTNGRYQSEHAAFDHSFVFSSFERHLAAHNQASRALISVLPLVAQAASLIVASLTDDGQIFSCGNGGSASEAEHFATELVGRFRYDRRSLAACSLTSDSAALTAIANDYGFDSVFARQIEGRGNPGDVLVAISTSGESTNVTRAAMAARHKAMRVITMSGSNHSSLSSLADVALQAPSEDTPTVQEMHMLFTHLICDAVESQLCPQEAAL